MSTSSPWLFGWSAIAALAASLAAVVTAIYANLVYRQLRDSRTARQRARDEAAIERAVRAIMSSGLLPPEEQRAPLSAPRILADALDVELQILSDRQVASRLRVTSCLLTLVYSLNTNADDHYRLVAIGSRAAASARLQLFALWRNEPLPPWRWEDDPPHPTYEWPESTDEILDFLDFGGATRE